MDENLEVGGDDASFNGEKGTNRGDALGANKAGKALEGMHQWGEIRSERESFETW